MYLLSSIINNQLIISFGYSSAVAQLVGDMSV